MPTYAVVKGSLYSNECSLFGLTAGEAQVLGQKFPGSADSEVLNGMCVKGSPVPVLNALAGMGYKVVAATGEAEVVWTLQRDK